MEYKASKHTLPKLMTACACILVLATAFTGCWVLERIPSIGPDIEYRTRAGYETDLLPVIDEKGNFGYIDITGSIVIKPQFQEAHFFFDGMAAVRKHGKWGFIDKTGQLAIPCQYDMVYDFYQGNASVGIDKGLGDDRKTMYGLINKQGELLLEHEYTLLFQEGDVVVGYKEGGDGSKIVYDKEFNITTQKPHVYEQTYYWVDSAYSDGRQLVYNRNYDYGFQDENETIVIPFIYEEARGFSEGLAAVQEMSRAGLWGYIGPDGTAVIPFQYSNAGSFREGLAWVRGAGEEAGCLSFINRDNEVQFTVKGDDAEVFQDGVCPVDVITSEPPVFIGSLRWIHKWGLVDNTGKLVLDYEYLEIMNLGNSLLRVVADTDSGIRYGYCDAKGSFIWEPK